MIPILKKTAPVIAALVAALVIIIATRPASFRVARSIRIAAPPEKVFAQVDDFRRRDAWSPWAKLDPNSRVGFSGAASGKGAVFSWEGNREVGKGRQEIIECEAPRHITISLEFEEPFQGKSLTGFTFEPESGGTRLTWEISGKNDFIAKAISLFMDCETMIGPQFEKGLSNIKQLAESQP